MAKENQRTPSGGRQPLLPTFSPELSPQEVARFQKFIYRQAKEHGRRLPWRETWDPFAILVSEFMLQQTQVARVLGRYAPFLEEFPDFGALAAAPLPRVLAAWQGLGYNRRALALKACAAQVVSRFGGRLPESAPQLTTLPGIGPATAGAVCAFAFEQPVAFLETNIRRVFLHHFFPGTQGVADGEILPLVSRTLDRRRPRQWYYALMDHGVHLGKRGPNPNRRSLHYVRQTPFAGSRRQVRGALLRVLLAQPGLTLTELAGRLGLGRERLAPVVEGLQKEGFLRRRGDRWHIAPRV